MLPIPQPDDRAQNDAEEHRKAMRRLAREVNAQVGIVGDPNMTIEELQAMMRAQGVRPEDNIASRELMRMRYGEDGEEE